MMENIIEILKTNYSILAMAVILLLLIFTVIIMIIQFSLLNKRYKNFKLKLHKKQ